MRGIGCFSVVVSADLVLADSSLSILEGVVIPWGEPAGYLKTNVLPALSKALDFDPKAPWRSYPKKTQRQLLEGAPGLQVKFKYGSRGSRGSYTAGWEGILTNVERRHTENELRFHPFADGSLYGRTGLQYM